MFIFCTGMVPIDFMCLYLSCRLHTLVGFAACVGRPAYVGDFRSPYTESLLTALGQVGHCKNMVHVLEWVEAQWQAVHSSQRPAHYSEVSSPSFFNAVKGLMPVLHDITASDVMEPLLSRFEQQVRVQCRPH